jgi:hypothetical protein
MSPVTAADLDLIQSYDEFRIASALSPFVPTDADLESMDPISRVMEFFQEIESGLTEEQRAKFDELKKELEHLPSVELTNFAKVLTLVEKSVLVLSIGHAAELLLHLLPQFGNTAETIVKAASLSLAIFIAKK